ncbi:DUF6752 domain-containing protein [Agromyces arachidis]|uniref:DUF6752 domain-containing protein n=1 Tax=Agromyces arachidis TaxID=766966 RepID=UPI0040575A33
MKRIRNAVRRLVPRPATTSADVERLERQILELRTELDELRADSARIAELYDLVFERLRPPAG